MAPFVRSAWSRLPEVLILAFEPVLPRGIKDVYVEGVLECLGAVAQVAWNVQHLTGSNVHLLLAIPSQLKAKRALKNVGELLVVVLMGRNLAAFLQVDVSDHHAIAGHHPPLELVREFLSRHRFPVVQRRLAFVWHSFSVRG